MTSGKLMPIKNIRRKINNNLTHFHMKILVTGGAGFIGSHVADALIKEGHNVIILDNLSTGQKQNLNQKADFIQADITDFEKVSEIFQKHKPEIIFHFAAQMDVRKSVEDPIFDARNNILASYNLIKLAHENGVKKFIFSSTGGATYGDTDERPTPETLKEWPLSPYGIAKLSIDKYLHYYHAIFGLKYTSLRYGNVYGPRQNPHGEAGVVAIFLKKMLTGETPTINGDGKQTRDYVFVEDVARANILALENIEKVGIYNVGTSTETDVNKLFGEINKNFGKKFKEIHGPAKLGEQKTSCLSYAKIKEGFGWIPSVDFSQGIKETFEWFSKNIYQL
jgi:UDP-glucose 4-epimerase